MSLIAAIRSCWKEETFFEKLFKRTDQNLASKSNRSVGHTPRISKIKMTGSGNKYLTSGAYQLTCLLHNICSSLKVTVEVQNLCHTI